MAYEIISQNNTTTTLSDGTNTITVPARVTLATSTSYTISEVNNNTATLEGSDGSVIRDVPCVVVLAGEGGGGSDPHNLGYYATQAALEEAHPTAEAGDWAIVGATDTVWLWDEDESAWVDSDQKGQVTSVNNQTGAVTLGINDVAPTQTGKSGYVLGTDGFVAGWVKPEIVQVSALPAASEEEVDNIYQFVGTTDANYTNGYFYKCVSDGQNPATYSWTQTDVQPAGSSLPSQTGNSGKFLTTDGTDASWAAISGGLPSQTGQSGKFLTTDGTDASWSDKPLVNKASSSNGSLVINGYEGSGTGVININSSWNTSSVYGVGAINIGGGSVGTSSYNRADYAIQLGGVNETSNKNIEPKTLCVGFSPSEQYKLLDSDGTIPTARLTKANTTVTLAVADWSSSTQTVSVTGVTATSIVFVAPDSASQSDYTSAGILCTAQGAGTLTFTCSTTPTNAITVNVVAL